MDVAVEAEDYSPARLRGSRHNKSGGRVTGLHSGLG